VLSKLPMMNIFPIIIISLSMWAGIVYALHKQPLHALYWMLAAGLNLTVLFMKEV
jgi:hypothetical protein